MFSVARRRHRSLSLFLSLPQLVPYSSTVGIGVDVGGWSQSAAEQNVASEHTVKLLLVLLLVLSISPAAAAHTYVRSYVRKLMQGCRGASLSLSLSLPPKCQEWYGRLLSSAHASREERL
jgi:hypothetical protein